MRIEDVKAIDVHGHYGVYDPGDAYGREAASLDDDEKARLRMLKMFMSGTPEEVERRAGAAKTAITVVSPLQAIMTRRKEEVLDGNRDAAGEAERRPGIMQWAVIHPLFPETYEQAAELLRSPRCAGIKIHPESHAYPIRQHGDRLFAFAAERKAVILAHSGEQNSLPADFRFFADRFPEAQLILAHLGMGWDGDYTLQVRAIQDSEHGNIYTDTSSSRSITPGLIEWAVAEIGAGRILFGTDTPLYASAMQRARIDHTDLEPEQQRQILRGNAVRLLKLDTDDEPGE